MNLLNTSLLPGVIRALWHLPLAFVEGSFQNGLTKARFLRSSSTLRGTLPGKSFLSPCRTYRYFRMAPFQPGGVLDRFSKRGIARNISRSPAFLSPNLNNFLRGVYLVPLSVYVSECFKIILHLFFRKTDKFGYSYRFFITYP